MPLSNVAEAFLIYDDVEGPDVFEELVRLFGGDRRTPLRLGQHRDDLVEPQSRQVGLVRRPVAAPVFPLTELSRTNAVKPGLR